nr:MAG TPA: hypothetical protein [Crassvirales sp.]
MVLKIRKNKKSYTIADMYKAFCKINADMPYMRFKRVLDQFNKVVKEDVLDRS